MADVNYVSPQGLLPKQGYSPQGFLGGMQYDQQMTDYRDMMGLQKLLSMMNAQKEQEDLTLGAPVRASKRLADIASNTSTAQTAIPLGQATLGLKQDEAKISRAGVDNKIIENAAKSIAAQGAAGMQQLQQQMKAAQIIGGIMQSNGPAGSAIVSRLAPQLGFKADDPFIQAIMQDPTRVTQVLNSINETLQGDLLKEMTGKTMDYQRTMDQTRLQGQNQLAVQDRANSGAQAVANIRTALQNNREKLENLAVALIQKKREGKLTKEDEIAYNDVMQALGYLRSVTTLQQQENTDRILKQDTPRTPPPTLGNEAVQNALKKLGQPYEPDKYDYRVTEDGKVQRAPK